MAWCVPYPALFRGAIYAARRARQIQFSAGRYHSGESVRSPEFLQGTLFYGLTAGFTSTVVRSWPGTIRRGRWARPRFWRVRIAGRDPAVTRTPSGKRYTGHLLRAQYQKILSARALRSASPAIATRQAAITILPKPAPLKAPRAVDNRRRREELSVSQSLGGSGQSGGFRPVAGVLASAESG